MAIEAQQSIFSELADFIVSQPTLTDIAEYRVPAAVEQRVQELLEKNREQGLSQEEQAEMDKFLAVSHLMTLAKAKARLKLPR
ncbi:MAG: hypothetical protein K8L99_00455 [Anaerolineae bacterium]|nr:hypothetical protein [Anaerolineae bacterium]